MIVSVLSGEQQAFVEQGDCIEVMKSMPEASVDAIVCDPPYDLTGASGKGGFMGKKWDAEGIAFDPKTWVEAMRVLKPGGHLIAFGGTRTYHRMACAIEDAGFEIRDCLAWMYGQGFAKGLRFLELHVIPEFEEQLRAQGVDGEIVWR